MNDRSRPPHHRLINRLIVAGAIASVVIGSALAASVAGAMPMVARSQPTTAARGSVEAVASIGITVSDLDRAVEFYSGVLGFEKVSEVEAAGDGVEHLSGVFGARCRIARLRLGEEFIELTQYLSPEGRPIPADSRSNDRWFQHIAIVVSDMDRAYKHLRARKVRHASSGPQTLPDWNPNAGGISAFYFKDPDGHVVEVIHFPTGKGDPRWQAPTDRLFLGIDHTAIVVADTDRSVAFYQGVLGMHVVGASENYGSEQEHLNIVFGARLRITALRAERGPGVELLEYLAPAGGREYPADAHANDLVHWHTTVITPTAEELVARLRDTHAAWVSAGLVVNVDGSADFGTGCQVRDPDGHAVIIGQATTARPAASATDR